MIKKNSFIFLTILPFLIIFWLFSSSSTAGPDYLNYIWMIDRIQSGDSFFDKIFLAKDIFFGFSVWLINPESRNYYYLIFFLILGLVLVSRILLIKKLGWGIYPYFLLYIIILSPGLDYAAIRALLGLSFIISYYCLDSKYKILLFLSFLSHVSMLVPVFFSLDIINRAINRIGVIFVSVSFFLFSLVVSRLLYLIPQTETYINQEGSWLLFFRIFGILFFTVIFYFITFENAIENFSKKLLRLSIILNSIALGAINVGIAANRVMEMACFFLLAALFSFNIRILNSKSKIIIYIVVLSILLLSFSYRNFRSDLWDVFYSVDFENIKIPYIKGV